MYHYVRPTVCVRAMSFMQKKYHHRYIHHHHTQCWSRRADARVRARAHTHRINRGVNEVEKKGDDVELALNIIYKSINFEQKKKTHTSNFYNNRKQSPVENSHSSCVCVCVFQLIQCLRNSIWWKWNANRAHSALGWGLTNLKLFLCKHYASLKTETHFGTHSSCGFISDSIGSARNREGMPRTEIIIIIIIKQK